MMNIWNQRRRTQRIKRLHQQRLQQQQQQRGTGYQTLDAKWEQLRLSMKYGELSDDFYSYCRRWRKDSDFLVRGRVLTAEPISSKPVATSVSVSIRLMFNFRFFTRLMLATYQTRLQRVAWTVCWKQIQTQKTTLNLVYLWAERAWSQTQDSENRLRPLEASKNCPDSQTPKARPASDSRPSSLPYYSQKEAASLQNDTCILKYRSIA